MNNGLLIALEGDARQFKLLRERLSAVGYSVESFNFPLVDHGSSHFVRSYTAGGYGPPESVSPYTATLFFAMDRYESAAKIREALARGGVVLVNRYVGATMAEQGAKFVDPIEQRSFFVWADSLDYQLLNVPRPAINIFIKSDSSSGHGQSANTMVELLCKLFPQDFQSVEGAKGGRSLEIAEVNNQIWDMLQPILPPRPDKPGHNVTVRLSDEPAQKIKKSKAQHENSYKIEAELSLAVIVDLERLVPGCVKYSLNWQQAQYAYVVPSGLSKKLQAKYAELLTTIVDQHKKMRQALKDKGANYGLLDSALPMAARLKVGLELSSDSVDKILSQFSSDKLAEKQQLIDLIEGATSRKLTDSRSKDPEKLDDIIARLAEHSLPQTLASVDEPVSLIEALPRNEFKIITESLYPYSSLPRDELDKQVDSWPYVQKEETLRKALAIGKPQLLGDVHYRFDVTAERRLVEHLPEYGVDIKSQSPTPRYGYEVPEAIESVGISEEYIECFDMSLELYSSLQAAAKEEYGVYAVLLGHKQRFQLGCTLEAIMRWQRQGDSGSRVLLQSLIMKLGEAHPIVGAYLLKPGPKDNTPRVPTRKSKRKNRSKK